MDRTARFCVVLCVMLSRIDAGEIAPPGFEPLPFASFHVPGGLSSLAISSDGRSAIALNASDDHGAYLMTLSERTPSISRIDPPADGAVLLASDG